MSSSQSLSLEGTSDEGNDYAAAGDRKVMMDGSSDSDAPEELTSHQGMEKEEEIRKIIRENKARVAREAKERRRKRVQKNAKPPTDIITEPIASEETQDNSESQPPHISAMLPESIVSLLAAREKIIFPEADEEVVGEDENLHGKGKKKRKKSGNGGVETVILKNLPGPPCTQSAMEFLKKRKMAVPRSMSTLQNPERAFRFLAKSGFLGSS